MNYLVYSEPERTQYPVCLLVSQIRRDEIKRAYLDPSGLDPDELMVLDLHKTGKKTPAAAMKEYVANHLQTAWTDLGVQYVLCADAEYFKLLTKSPKAEANLGYVMQSAYGPQQVIYLPDYRSIFYDPPKVKAKIAQAMDALAAHRGQVYLAPGADIIQFSSYPSTPVDIERWLEMLLQWDRPLTCDIEAFSLKHHTAGIATISFAWSKHEGIAFAVDLSEHSGVIRGLLISFFTRFKQKIIYHNIAFDAYILVYQLFMTDLLDTEGLLNGLEYLLSNWDCTKLITYLATNSCAGNKLGLKEQAQEFAGNYAIEEIKDVTKVPLPQLLQYNLIDALSTWFVHEKHYDTMVADQQQALYLDLFKPATVDIVQMQLTGLPVDMNQVKLAKQELLADYDKAYDLLQASPLVEQYVYFRNERWVTEKNAALKKKRVTLADARETFNPASGPQLIELLFEQEQLPVLALTDTKLPATDMDTLEKLKAHTNDKAVLSFLTALIDFKAVEKILTSVIPALEGAVQGPDGWHYLFGNFNLGGTLSGRLSSSKPNLQNLPATGTRYAKIIKMCFAAPPGWIFCGLDFDSLEDRISALTSKDPMKLKVYIGHTLYELVVDGVVHRIRDDTTIVYDGKTYTGDTFYEAFGSV